MCLRPSTTYLKYQHSRVCDSQVDSHSLPIVGRVRPDAIHIQLPGHLQHLDVRVCWRRTSSKREGLGDITGITEQHVSAVTFGTFHLKFKFCSLCSVLVAMFGGKTSAQSSVFVCLPVFLVKLDDLVV